MIHEFVMRVKHFVVVGKGRRYVWKVHFVVDYVIVVEEGQEAEDVVVVVVVCHFVFRWVVQSVVVLVQRGKRCMWRMRMRRWILL